MLSRRDLVGKVAVGTAAGLTKGVARAAAGSTHRGTESPVQTGPINAAIEEVPVGLRAVHAPQIVGAGRLRVLRRRRVLLKMEQVHYPLVEVDASLQDNDPENDLPLQAPALGLYMRRGRKWEYSTGVDRDIDELYDLRRDPMGLDDLSDQRRGRLRGMRRRALKWNDQLEALRCPVVP